jgi:phage shock protein A
MSHAEKVRQQIEALEARLARLRLTRTQLLARATRAERKRDTRRKIVLGGTVLAALAQEGVPALRTPEELARWLDARLKRPADRAAFDLDVKQKPR